MLNNFKDELSYLTANLNIKIDDQYIKNGLVLDRKLLNKVNIKRYVFSLTRQVYNECYCRKKLDTDLHINYNLGSKNVEEIDKFFLNRLATANQFNQGWNLRWKILNKFSNGTILVSKNEEIRLVFPGEYVFETFPQAKNNEVSIKAYKDYMNSASPDFFFVFGEQYYRNSCGSIIRFYFNLQPEGAPILIKHISRILNRFEVPFQFKCLVSPSHYTRFDSAVLYIEKRYYNLVRELILDVYSELTSYLNKDIPLFTFCLADGIGMAEQPANNGSFGMHISMMLTEGLVECLMNNSNSKEWAGHIERRFNIHGVSLEFPYLNNGSNR
jgi:hypothetical protein